jgi:hypothetical protein
VFFFLLSNKRPARLESSARHANVNDCRIILVSREICARRSEVPIGRCQLRQDVGCGGPEPISSALLSLVMIGDVFFVDVIRLFDVFVVVTPKLTPESSRLCDLDDDENVHNLYKRKKYQFNYLQNCFNT